MMNISAYTIVLPVTQLVRFTIVRLQFKNEEVRLTNIFNMHVFTSQSLTVHAVSIIDPEHTT